MRNSNSSILAFNVQAAWCACMFLARAAWWAVRGRPRPPQLHASPTLARLRACASAREAKQASLAAGFDREGEFPVLLALIFDHLMMAACSQTSTSRLHI